jgi:hypothetical protein
MRCTGIRTAALAAAVLGGGGLAFGQDAQAKPNEAEPAPAAKITTQESGPRPQAQFTVRGMHEFSGDLKDSAGSVSIDRAGANFSMLFPVGDRSQLSVGLGSELSFYNFKDATGFASGFTEPWDDTEQLNGTVSFRSQATGQWSWYAGAGVDASLQRGADFERSVTGGLFGGVNYGISERLNVGLGMVLRSRLEDNGQVLPIPSVHWRISDKWSLGTSTGVAGSGAALTYRATEDLSFALEGAYETREFRLDDSAAAPDGVGRDHRIPISVSAAWNITHQIAVGGRVGVDVYQEYTLVDSSSNEVAKVKTDPSIFIGASLVISF